MVRLQNVSFKDWNPIGKPRKKTKGKSENLSESVKCEILNTEDLSKRNTSKNAEPFGMAATLELTHSYVKDKNYTKQYSADKESNFLSKKADGGIYYE